jgi:histidinol-phosphate aminotransferase
MSRFLSREAGALEPYTPGEQPGDQPYNKLNTNESPFPPSPKVLEALEREKKLNLYSDPTCGALCDAIAKRNGLNSRQVIAGNGSDELLSFAFRAFCGAGRSVAYADITYGFYKVWAQFYGLEARVIPLREDFTLSVDDYLAVPGTIFLANPNAPTGLTLPRSEIRRLLSADRDRVVVVDEAYVDFGGESCVPLLAEFDNLLVMQTFSKSRSLAGGRIGFAMGSPELIDGMNRVKYSFNPYNVNRLSIAAGAAAMADEAYFQKCTAAIRENRAWTERALKELGFAVLPSRANFLFAGHGPISGEELYRSLKERGILVRHFSTPERITDFCRITIGSMEQMRALIAEMGRLIQEGGHRNAYC